MWFGKLLELAQQFGLIKLLGSKIWLAGLVGIAGIALNMFHVITLSDKQAEFCMYLIAISSGTEALRNVSYHIGVGGNGNGNGSTTPPAQPPK